MLSKYFKLRIQNKDFVCDLNNLICDLSDKKIILYGAGDEYLYLSKQFDFSKLNIIAIADKKFEKTTEFDGMKAILPQKIEADFEGEYDFILVTQGDISAAIDYLVFDLDIDILKVKTIFSEKIPEESASFAYLDKFNFEKHLDKISKKFQGKRIVIYGAGVFFEVIKKYYNLSALNIVAISDKRFENHKEGEKFLDYPVCAPDEILEINPDYVLVATKFFINIIEDLSSGLLKGSNIKVKPLLKKPFKILLEEIWKK